MAVKKFIARDCELSTTGFDADGDSLDCWVVAKKVLAQIGPALAAHRGVVWSSDSRYGSRYSMDCLRQWTSAGQCYYSDMGHVEACSAETLDPYEFAAQSISLLLAAEEARRLAEERDDELHLALAASNVDALHPDISWGTHLNVSVSEDLWEDMFVLNAHPARLGFVASAFAAAIPFFGTGYVKPRRDAPALYSLSGRAHHLTRVHTLSTTEAFNRGLLNTRRESHGRNDRLHLIGFDFCIASAALMASFVQCVLAAAEEGYCGCQLYSPVESLHRWSFGLDLSSGTLPASAPLIDGRRLTLPGFMRALSQELLAMCEAGLISPEAAPDAKELLPRIIELAHYVEEGSLEQAARHLDWAAKLLCLLARGEPLDAPGTRLADHDFSNTDPRRGLLWRLIEAGRIDPLVGMERAEKCLVQPPPESRAWGRGQLIKRFQGQVVDVNWGCVEVRSATRRWNSWTSIDMPHLDDMNRESLGPLLRRANDVDHLRRLLQQPRSRQRLHFNSIPSNPVMN